MAITFPGEFRPGGATSPQATPEWYLKFLSAEADETAALMGFFQQARLELEDFIRTGDLSVSDATFYRDLLDETNRVASTVNRQSATWVSNVIPEAYTAGRRLTSSVVIPEKALTALAKDPLRLLTSVTDDMRLRVRQGIATGILEGLSGAELRARIVSTGLTNIPRWPSVEYRAGVIARTETMKAFNGGALQGYEDNGARFVRWIASPDEATCPICLPRDGQVYRISGEPGENDPYPAAQILDPAPAHPRCRCTVRAEYRDADGNVIRDVAAPPPVEVDPKLSQGDMGADKEPELPPAAGDMRKALAGLTSKEVDDLLYYSKASVVNPGTGLDDLAMVARRDAARKKLDELRSFWRHVDFDDDAMRLIAGLEGGTIVRAKDQMHAIFGLRYGINFATDGAWSKGAMFSSLKAIETLRARHPRWVVDSPLLTHWGSAPFGARRMSGSRAAEMYSTCHMRPNFTAMRKYVDHVDGYNVGVDDTVLTVLVHELGHSVHNRYGLHGNPVEFGDDVYEKALQKGAFEDAWRRDPAMATGGKVAPNTKASDDLAALRTRLASWEERSATAGYAGAYTGVINSMKKQIAEIEARQAAIASGAPLGEHFPTDYARKGGYAEDFAESFMLYLLNPERLQKYSPARYEFLRTRVFGDPVP